MTNDRISDLPQRSGSFQAVVRAGDSVTAYLRSGRGAPVVLLRRAGHHEGLWGLVLAEVSGAFRAIVPERAPEGPEFERWFRSFLDGLGMGAVHVVADAHFGMRCADSGLIDPDWLTVLVVVTDMAERDDVAQSLSVRATPQVPTAILDAEQDDAMTVARRTVQALRQRNHATG